MKVKLILTSRIMNLTCDFVTKTGESLYKKTQKISSHAHLLISVYQQGIGVDVWRHLYK